jgi:hypothetical protein
MLINNLGSLKAELARYMMHQRFQPDYDTAVQNFEAVANRRLRVRQMETTVTLTTDLTLPSNYLLWRTVLYIGNPASPRSPLIELDYVHPTYFRTTWIDADHGDPKIFRIIGSNLSVKPNLPTGHAIQFHYYQKIPTINGDDNNSNWLVTEHPDLYLNGALFELFALGRNGEAAAVYKPLRDEKFAELMQLSALSTGATSDKVRSATAEYF